MVAEGQDKAKAPSVPRDGGENLPYVIELWSESGTDVDRVLARASTASLGQAIFEAATKENKDRRICLRQGTRLLADSQKPSQKLESDAEAG